MRLTQYTDFSIRVLIYLGLHPDRRCTIQEIAEGYGISRNHLMKVVQQLAGAGFVTSARGSGGGLTCLARPKRSIWPTWSPRWSPISRWWNASAKTMNA